MRGLVLWELHRHGLRVNEYFLGSFSVLPAWHGACPGRQVRNIASKRRLWEPVQAGHSLGKACSDGRQLTWGGEAMIAAFLGRL